MKPDGATSKPRGRLRVGGLQSLAVSLVVVGLIVGGLWYLENRGAGPLSDSPYGTVDLPDDRNPTGLAPLSRIDRAAPDFLLERPDGGTLRLSDLQGHPVLVNFWATWCAPCRAEMPELVEAFAAHEGDGLVIVGVDLQESDAKILKFADEFGITFPLVVDRDADVRSVWQLGGPFSGIPSSYFLDASGVIRDRVFGPMTRDVLAERLQSILPAGSP